VNRTTKMMTIRLALALTAGLALAWAVQSATRDETPPRSAVMLSAGTGADGSHSLLHPFSDVVDDGTCRCAAARRENGWCSACAVGYVAGVRVPSAVLFETLDAHGHDIDRDAIECSTCRIAESTDGFCASCRWGFVGGRLYFSKLTYTLARGRVIEPPARGCPSCAQAAEGTVWCGTCRAGWVGNVRFEDQSAFELARPEYARLLAAIEASGQCRLCAVGMFAGGACPRHGSGPVAPANEEETSPDG
jgi:hypothetical protein